MFAVIKTGGKQYRAAPGARLAVERLDGDVGDVATLSDVLMIGGGDGDPIVGDPTIAGASVRARIEAQDRARKIIVFKKRRRKKSRSTQGHRQRRTWLRIEAIDHGA